MANKLQKIYEDIDAALAKKQNSKSSGQEPDNPAVRIPLMATVAKDVLMILQPILETLIDQSKTNKEEFKKIIESIKVEPNIIVNVPDVNVPEANVNVKMPDIKIPDIKVPPIIVPTPVVNVPDFPKEMAVTGFAGLLKTLVDAFKGVFRVEVQQDRDRPLNVILCDDKGNQYKAAGGGGVVGGVVGAGNSAAHRAMQAEIQMLELTDKDTIYPFTIPDGTQKMDITLVSGGYSFQYSYNNFTSYFPMAAGSVKTLSEVNLKGKTLYFRCTEAAGETLSIEILKR